MSDTTYNGWTGKGSRESAYATWRVNLELVDDMREDISEWFEEKPDRHMLAEYLEASIIELVLLDDLNLEKLVAQYAYTFLQDVCWEEIADNILADWDEH